MKKREYKTGLDLSDREWNILEPLLPEAAELEGVHCGRNVFIR